jgi:hypothetical protein
LRSTSIESVERPPQGGKLRRPRGRKSFSVLEDESPVMSLKVPGPPELYVNVTGGSVVTTLSGEVAATVIDSRTRLGLSVPQLLSPQLSAA